MEEKIPSLFEDNDNNKEEVGENNEGDKTNKGESDNELESENETAQFERKEDENFDEFLNRIRSQYKYDPRPDLTEDSQLWEKVLRNAATKDNKVYSILHGFRCGGAKLEIKNNKVNMKPRIGEKYLWQSQDEYDKDRKEWLMPLRESISEIFDAVDQFL